MLRLPPPPPPSTSLPLATHLCAAAICATSAQRFDSAAHCQQFEAQLAANDEDLSFLGEVQFVTVGNNKLAYRRISAGAPPDATPLLLLMG